MKKPSLLELCKTSLYIGTVAYGGPAALAQMKKTLVQQKQWIPETEFMNGVSLAQVLPGATGVDVMGYVGYKLHKLWGGILAPIMYILPATVLIIILAWAYFTFGNLSFIKSLFTGLGALVVALLINATFTMGAPVFKKLDLTSIKAAIISSLTFIGIYFLNVSVVWIILAAGLIGFALYYFTRELEESKVKPGNSSNNNSATLATVTLRLVDFTPVLLVVVVLGIGLLTPTTRELITTFLGIGSLAFGGAFGSVPLIQHQVVDMHSWLTTKQFIDGIAMGQITPGPVLITATFIGYRVTAIVGAFFATIAIFAPSLAAMIALADVHEKVQKARAVKAIIKGFQAGFIGILLSVTLNFALKSLVIWQAWLIFALALVWLMVFKKNAGWAIIGTIVVSLLIV